MSTTTKLVEWTAAGSPVVDREANVIKGVRILGLESRNGRTYSEAAVKKAIPLYEGRPVNIDHGNPAESRSYRDRFGVIRGVAFENSGLIGNLHYNPKHPLTEQALWDAENSPNSLGLSHVAEAVLDRIDGKSVVEEILSVESVDLVADPATTNSLFEATMAKTKEEMDSAAPPANTEIPTAPAAPDPIETVKGSIEAGLIAIYRGDGDPKDKAKRMAALMQTEIGMQKAMKGDSSGGESEGDEPSPPKTESVERALARADAIVLLEDAEIDQTPELVAAVAGLETTEARKTLVESLGGLRGKSRPAPRDAKTIREGEDKAPTDGKSWAQSITG